MDMIVLWYVLVPVLYSECIAGVIINLIIVAANIIKWRRAKSVLISDKILSSLATSRSLYLMKVVLVDIFSHLDLWEIINNPVIFEILNNISMFLYSTNLWFATVLCVFYCVKITNHSWKFFILLKTKISTLVPWFLLASLLISLSFSLIFSLRHLVVEQQNLLNISMENLTLDDRYMYGDYKMDFMLLLIGSCPPFLIFLLADSLLLHSLWMHIRRMRSSSSGFRFPNLESHFSAVKSMSLFLVLQTMYFVASVYLYSAEFWEITTYYVICIVIYSPDTLHSLYIISTNSDIKKTYNSRICATY
ncbi:hypothetical protein GDO81_028870 [Engystomops pustulosus]|uniref:Taste receptor type 2 n=1 Tax=Engystomops pustulosus TaxID=76066 RepID=A0AAV6ZL36_ENGPU|nr:hypothetical protein GDO81_028870 [Engystomops pustulosus]